MKTNHTSARASIIRNGPLTLHRIAVIVLTLLTALSLVLSSPLLTSASTLSSATSDADRAHATQTQGEDA